MQLPEKKKPDEDENCTSDEKHDFKCFGFFEPPTAGGKFV